MNLLTSPGNLIYMIVTGIACLGGLLVSFVTLFGLAWGGTSHWAFDTAAIVGNLSTIGLFTGLIGSRSERKSLTIVTFLGATFVPAIIAIIYSPVLFRAGAKIQPGGSIPPTWLLLLIVDGLTMLLALLKFRQLRTSR